jgi:hypothetical protein
MVCCSGLAQSGRRATKPLSPPTPTEAAKEAEPAQTPKPAVKQQTLIAGMDASLDIPSYLSEALWNGFIERFGKISSIVVNGDRNMSRKEATDRAKKVESPVILLQLGTQSAMGSMSQMTLEDLIVNFTIFTPGTGKAGEQGRVHIRPIRSIIGRLPSGRSGEAQMKEAGREAAERVLSLLHVGAG